jgi:PII-like signaling protein
MKLAGEQVLLRVYLRNTDKYGWWRSAGDTLVQKAREQGLAGATMIRGFFGLDADGDLLEQHLWSVTERRPVIVEFVDSPGAIGRFLSVVEDVVLDGLATLERGHVLLYRHEGVAAIRSAEQLTVPGPIPDLSTLPSPEEFPAMTLSENGQLLRVFIGESDTWAGEPLYRAIVLRAKDLGMAGATVLHGAMGFGANSRVHTTKLLELSTDLPVVVEIVDTADKVQQLLPFLDEAVGEGMITIEAVKVLRYRHDPTKVRGPKG